MEILKGALSIVLIYATFQDGNVFCKIQKLLWNAPWWIKKPLFKCLTCMTSMWGSLAFFFFCDLWNVEQYVKFIFPLGGVLFIIDYLLRLNGEIINDQE